MLPGIVTSTRPQRARVAAWACAIVCAVAIAGCAGAARDRGTTPVEQPVIGGGSLGSWWDGKRCPGAAAVETATGYGPLTESGENYIDDGYAVNCDYTGEALQQLNDSSSAIILLSATQIDDSQTDEDALQEYRSEVELSGYTESTGYIPADLYPEIRDVPALGPGGFVVLSALAPTQPSGPLSDPTACIAVTVSEGLLIRALAGSYEGADPDTFCEAAVALVAGQ